MKHRWIYLVALCVLPHFFSTPVLSNTPDAADVSGAEVVPELTIEQLENMSSAEIAALCEKEGIDIRDINDMLLAKGHIETRLPAGVQPRPQQPSFSDRVKQVRDQMPEYSKDDLTYQAALYVGEEATAIPEPRSSVTEVAEKVDGFMNKYVRGKGKQALMLIGFVVYRQISYLYSLHLKDIALKDMLGQRDDVGLRAFVEQREKAMRESSFLAPSYQWKDNKLQPRPQGVIAETLGMVGMNSRLAEATDVAVRLIYCGSRLWVDMSSHIRLFRYNTFACLADMESYMAGVIQSWRHIYNFFYNPFHVGAELTLMKRVLLGVSVPFAFYSLLSRVSPGNPFGHPQFRSTMGISLASISNDAGLSADRKFSQMVKPSLRKKLFKASGGIIRDRLFLDIASMLNKYILKRFNGAGALGGKPFTKSFGSYMGRQTGKYAIRHVYLHAVISLIKIICRHGGVSGANWLIRRVGDLFAGLGFFQRNPFDQAHDRLQELCVGQGWMTRNDDLGEFAASRLCYAYPGSLVRAVQKNICKEDVAAIAKKHPSFLKGLEDMNGVTLSDLLHSLAINPMLPAMIMQSVESIRTALSAQQWQTVMRAVPTEIFIDQFLNRERFFCQFITESLVGWMSRPVLKSLNHAILPRSSA